LPSLNDFIITHTIVDVRAAMQFVFILSWVLDYFAIEYVRHKLSQGVLRGPFLGFLFKLIKVFLELSNTIAVSFLCQHSYSRLDIRSISIEFSSTVFQIPD
jgi:hypothetical protein